MSTRIQRSPVTSGPGICGGFGGGTDGVGVKVGVGVSVTVGDGVGVYVGVAVNVCVAVGVNVAVGAAKTFHDSSGPYARSENATAVSPAESTAAAAITRKILLRITFDSIRLRLDQR